MTFLEKRFSRRQFLQLMGAGALVALLPKPTLWEASAQGARKRPQLGRVCYWNTFVYSEPSVRSKVTAYLDYDDLFRLPEVTIAPDNFDKPKPWYQLADDQFVEAGWIQPVTYEPNVSFEPIPEGGCLGEQTVPIITVNTEPGGWRTQRKYYFSSTHWVMGRHEDSHGLPWYELIDDVNGGSYYVRAYALRLVPKEEFEPIAPDLPLEAKHLELSLSDQTVRAFENDKQVFEAVVSTGLATGSTPLGTFITSRKRPTRRMVNEPASENFYDLPGVPWVSYFTDNGVAFHGAYWHANWGHRMSNGCINMKPEEAKWIYRWCDPKVPFNERYVMEKYGTRVEVLP